MRNEDKLLKLSKLLGYSFNKLTLLAEAITHRSTGSDHNERLEFLGDSLLNFTIAADLFSRFPRAKEGELTRMRARLVREETLAEIARDLKLGDFIQLGPGEKKSGGHTRASILADTLEAIIAAIFLDSNILECQQRILSWYEERLKNLVPESSEKDSKTLLQEYLQSKRYPLPEYQVLEISGDAHDPTFKVQCTVSLINEPIIGIAPSRRKAEQMAAQLTLKTIKDLKKSKDK